MNKANNIRGTNNLIEANTKLFDENKWLKADNERLERIINKANDYISTIFEYNEETGEYYAKHTIDKDNIKELHDILRGDKE